MTTPQPLELTTTLQPRGPAAAIILDDDQAAAVGGGAKAFPVSVTIDGHTGALRLARMGGENLIGFSKAARAQFGVEAGAEVTALIARDDSTREVEVPDDLARALDDAGVRAAFDALAPSRRKEHARSVADAKKPETRARRVEAIVAGLAS